MPPTATTTSAPPTTAPPPSTSRPGDRDAFCAYLTAWGSPQTSEIASMGAEGLAMVEEISPITPAEMLDEIATLQSFYAAAANMDFGGIDANADAFGNAWNSIFAYCGVATTG